MKKFKLSRDRLKFEYEFKDGTTSEFVCLASTTEQIDKGVETFDTKGQLDHVKAVLDENLSSSEDGACARLVAEQTSGGNLYAFKASLDEEKKKKKNSA